MARPSFGLPVASARSACSAATRATTAGTPNCSAPAAASSRRAPARARLVALVGDVSEREVGGSRAEVVAESRVPGHRERPGTLLAGLLERAGPRLDQRQPTHRHDVPGKVAAAVGADLCERCSCFHVAPLVHLSNAALKGGEAPDGIGRSEARDRDQLGVINCLQPLNGAGGRLQHQRRVRFKVDACRVQ